MSGIGQLFGFVFFVIPVMVFRWMFGGDSKRVKCGVCGGGITLTL